MRQRTCGVFALQRVVHGLQRAQLLLVRAALALQLADLRTCNGQSGRLRLWSHNKNTLQCEVRQAAIALNDPSSQLKPSPHALQPHTWLLSLLHSSCAASSCSSSPRMRSWLSRPERWLSSSSRCTWQAGGGHGNVG